MLAIAIVITVFAFVIGLALFIGRRFRKQPNKVYPPKQKGRVILDEVEESSWHPKYDLN